MMNKKEEKQFISDFNKLASGDYSMFVNGEKVEIDGLFTGIMRIKFSNGTGLNPENYTTWLTFDDWEIVKNV